MESVGFQHEVLIYEEADDYLGGTVPFLRAALEAGEPALVAVRGERADLLKAALGGEADRVSFVDIREVARNPAAIIPLWRGFVDRHRGRPVRGISEPAWADRAPAAMEECHRHEGLLNLAFADLAPWRLLCPYDASSLDDEVLARAAESHPRVHRRGGSVASGAYVPDPDCFAGRLPQPAGRPEALSFGLADLAGVRHQVRAAAIDGGLDLGGVADLVTAVSELAANSVTHGGGSGTLRLWREGEDLVAEVEDSGRIDEPLVGRVRPDVSQAGGRGLWLANRLCDLVQIRSDRGGTRVRLRKVTTDARPSNYDLARCGASASARRILGPAAGTSRSRASSTSRSSGSSTRP